MKRIAGVIVLADYLLDITFTDGTRGTVDLSDLAGSGVFALWNDYTEFRKVRIGDTGELIWSDQVDLCPDSLYLRMTGKTELLGDWRRAQDHAPLERIEPLR
jgi:hypothetical protein